MFSPWRKEALHKQLGLARDTCLQGRTQLKSNVRRQSVRDVKLSRPKIGPPSAHARPGNVPVRAGIVRSSASPERVRPKTTVRQPSICHRSREYPAEGLRALWQQQGAWRGTGKRTSEHLTNKRIIDRNIFSRPSSLASFRPRKGDEASITVAKGDMLLLKQKHFSCTQKAVEGNAQQRASHPMTF